MIEICIVCEGSGLRIVREGGRQVARPCECRIQRRQDRALERSGIPKRYEHCSLESYETGFAGADRTLWAAQMRARKFVEGYPLETSDTGLMLVGSVGVGKTHLAVGILRGLITDRGATGLFCDYRDLLKQVQNSYNLSVAATEMEVLRPVFEAEILVLDELGASKPSEWVWDTVAHILNTRYNERRTTIITTNFANEAPLTPGSATSETVIAGAVEAKPNTDEGKRALAAMRKETLGDRIGERMRSRLQEMCEVIEIYGKDFRKSVRRADLASGTRQAIVGAGLRTMVEQDREIGKAIHDGAERLIPGHPSIDKSVAATSEPDQEKPVVGVDRLGSWAFKNRMRR
jgi:DNA replication protein DnaC